jgi:hypothetical protein
MSDQARETNGRYHTDHVTYADIRRLDQLMAAERDRVNGLFQAQETAVNAALVAQEKAVAAALAASEKAVNKAEAAQARVNETQNEFRGTLADQARELMPRKETESLIREVRGLLDGMVTTREGLLDDVRAQLGDLRSRLDVGPPTLGKLQAGFDQDRGRAAQVLDTRTLLLTLVGLAIAGAMLFSALHR